MTEITAVTISSENKCSLCTRSKCCTYVTQSIPTPRAMSDFDLLLWQVSHAGTAIYKDEDGWFLLFEGACRHLLADGRCGIYDRRPEICRNHKNEYCEFDAPAEEGFELWFPDDTALDAYCRKRFRRWDARHAKR